MTELQHQLVETVQQMNAAAYGSDEWLYWSREHSRVLNERQQELYREKYPVVQFEPTPGEHQL